MVPNGCDLDIFDSKVCAWRPNMISDSDFLVLYAGTHGISNGLDSVLNAAAELKSRGKFGIKFLLLGQGKLKQSLIDRANHENLDNVMFHDPVDKKQLSGLMASTNIGLQVLTNVPAFYYGTSPNKFFDYISAGLPVLNNYPGWLADIIDRNGCGFTVPPDDPISFADALESAASDSDDLKIRSAKAKALAIREFDRKNLIAQWVDQLENTYLEKIGN